MFKPDTQTGNLILKVVNAGNESKIINIDLSVFKKVISTAELEVLTVDPDAGNTLENPEMIVPVKSPFKDSKRFEYSTHPMSLSVIRIKTK